MTSTYNLVELLQQVHEQNHITEMKSIVAVDALDLAFSEAQKYNDHVSMVGGLQF